MRAAMVAVLAIAAHIGLGLLVHHHHSFWVDRAAFDVLQPLEFPTGRRVIRVVTDLGAFPAVAVVVIAAAVVAGRDGRVRDVVLLVVGALLLMILVDVSKQIWDRPRPLNRYYDPHGTSFPSGHSAQAITWIAAARVTGRRGLLVAGIVVALTIGLCRLYLHVHYLTDVLGGYALGIALLAPVLVLRTRPA